MKKEIIPLIIEIKGEDSYKPRSIQLEITHYHKDIGSLGWIGFWIMIGLFALAGIKVF